MALGFIRPGLTHKHTHTSTPTHKHTPLATINNKPLLAMSAEIERKIIIIIIKKDEIFLQVQSDKIYAFTKRSWHHRNLGVLGGGWK